MVAAICFDSQFMSAYHGSRDQFRQSIYVSLDGSYDQFRQSVYVSLDGSRDLADSQPTVSLDGSRDQADSKFMSALMVAAISLDINRLSN